MEFQAYQRESGARRLNAHFAPYPMRPEDELPHPVPADAAFNWTETHMFGFNIPEHGIDVMIWYVHRPKLGSSYGGILLWQGMKSHYLESEIFDFRAALPLPPADMHWDCPNDISIHMIEPLECFEIRYRQPDGDIRFDLTLTAVMPPALRYNGNHITQAMRTDGALHMGGQDYVIDGYYSRDRSWDENRDEGPKNVPPLSWIAGVFGDDFAFHLTAFEHADRRPEWAGLYPAPRPGENILWGYVWNDGALDGIADADMIVERPDGLNPTAIRMVLTTASGRVYAIDGAVTALNPAMGWPNIVTRYGLTRWTCNGREGWGDIQDVMFGQHIRRVAAAAGG